MTKKTKIEITEKLRKKYGACEHDQVSYKELEKLNRALFQLCKRLSRDIFYTRILFFYHHIISTQTNFSIQ